MMNQKTMIERGLFPLLLPSVLKKTILKLHLTTRKRT